MSLLSCSTMFTEIHTEISSTIVVPLSVSFFLACCACCASINGSFGESFSKVFASFRYPFSCIFKHAICFYCAALSHLGLSVHMYVCIRMCDVCMPFLFVFVRVAPWNVYILSYLLCCDCDYVLCEWTNFDLHLTLSHVLEYFLLFLVSFLLLILSLLLFVLLLLLHVQHFQFWFHWLSLIAVDRVSCGKFTMILLVRWFHSLRHWLLLLLLLRIFVACCCCC